MASNLLMGYLFVFIAFTTVLGLVQPSKLLRFKRTLDCGKNETMSNCGPCDNRCPMKSNSTRKPQHRQCPTKCNVQQPTCRCKDGYYRFNNLCLLETDCPAVECQKNEKVASCAIVATWCQPTCSKPQGGNNATDVGGAAAAANICAWQVCDVPTCVCNDGFIRDDKTLQCIPVEDCPAGANGAKKRLVSLN